MREAHEVKSEKEGQTRISNFCWREERTCSTGNTYSPFTEWDGTLERLFHSVYVLCGQEGRLDAYLTRMILKTFSANSSLFEAACISGERERNTRCYDWSMKYFQGDDTPQNSPQCKCSSLYEIMERAWRKVNRTLAFENINLCVSYQTASPKRLQEIWQCIPHLFFQE